MFRMRDRVLGAAAWAIFAFIVGCGSYQALTACDLGPRPIFGLSYCAPHSTPDHLADQHARERDLRTHIHEAELRIARLPSCLASPSSPPEPRKQVHTDAPPPRPEAADASTEELKIPQNVAKLKGCWESVRGDITLFSDDERHRPMGDVRVCYCFTDDGQGATRYIYSDGSKCVGPLRVRLSSDRLLINHGQIPCSGPSNHGSVVPGEIDCKTGTEGESAICNWLSNGRFLIRRDNLRYRRVTEAHCN
jgi:hypothetical protein